MVRPRWHVDCISSCKSGSLQLYAVTERSSSTLDSLVTPLRATRLIQKCMWYYRMIRNITCVRYTEK